MGRLSLRFWPFFLTRTFTVTRQLNAPVSDVLEQLLHNPEVALSLSPLIVSVVADAPSQTQAHFDMGWYTLKERLHKGKERTITLRVLWGRVSDGADTTVFAPLGTRVRSSMRAREVKVEEGGEPQTLFEETLTIEGLCFLMPHIFAVAYKTHTDMLDTVAARVRK